MNEVRIKKLYLFLVCFAIVTIAIFFRLFNLTVKDRKSITSLDGLDKPRGTIYDSKMRPLTINIPAYTIYLDTESVSLDGNENTDINEAYSQIFSIIGITKEKFTDLISTKRRTIRLAQNINLDSYKKIKEIKDKYTVKSIYGIESYKRFYPYEDVFAHVIGYMNRTETEGYAGLEATYESILSH